MVMEVPFTGVVTTVQFKTLNLPTTLQGMTVEQSTGKEILVKFTIQYFITTLVSAIMNQVQEEEQSV